MKCSIFVTFVSLIQFLAVQALPVSEEKHLNVVYKFDVELEKYRDVMDKRAVNEETIWHDSEEIEIAENKNSRNIIKRMALEPDEEFEEKIRELSEKFELEGDDEVTVDEVPNEFPHEDDKLVKRASISSSEYFRSQLSSFEKKIYDAIYNLFNKSSVSSLSVQLSSLTSYGINKSYILKYSSRAIGALVRDHPEFWWIKKYSISYSLSGSTISKLKVTISSDYSISSINSYKTKVKSKASSVASTAKGKSSTYNKLLYIHDYLVKYIKYDDGNDYAYNMYGALVKNKSACEGYAESFTFIARLLSVPTICVASTSHKWNYVYLNSKWYAVDVTFDDPTINGVTYSSGESANLSHKFFLIGKDTVIKGSKTYTTYSNRKLVSYVEFTSATGFSFPSLTSKAYKS